LSPAPALPAPVTHAQAIDYRLLAGVVVGALTVARLVLIAVHPAGLYPDEAQYWFWAQTPALGYYSKPPLIAWVIALTTGLLGDSEFAIRLSAPLLHAATAGFVFAIAARLYDRRTGFWAALAYATLPGVSLSAFLISTDAVLLPCWAAALYAFIRAREPGSRGWWVVVGIAAGLGFLAKYAMAYWLLSALGYLLLVRGERRHLPGFLAAIGLALLIWLPNLWWNWSHGFVSFLHVRANAAIAGPASHPNALFEFFASQFGVFGPLFFAGLIAIVARTRALAEPRTRLLAAFALPTLAIMLLVSVLSRAEPNWAAPAYIAAVVLVVAWGLQRNWHPTLIFAVALNLAAAAVVLCGQEALAAAGIALPVKYDPLHRLRGWRELGRQVGVAMAAHPNLTLLADDRELVAALIYYVRPHPFDAVRWSVIPGITDQWLLDNNIERHRGEDFLAVTEHGLVEEMSRRFTELTPLQAITTPSGPGGGRTYTLYIARNYQGEPPR
jgi:4-amino-4-deoxy-L-arabinose transferase-like glycosyltransferase